MQLLFHAFIAVLSVSAIDAATIEIKQSIQNSKERTEQTSSTLQPFDFDIGLTDSSVNFNNLDLFANASNSDKDSPRIQNIFIHVFSKDTNKPVPFILQERGRGGYKGFTEGIYLSVLVPFSEKERTLRIKSAIEEYGKLDPSKTFQLPPAISPVTFFDTYELIESKPGDYILSVDFIAPSGKISSRPLEFTIRDRGNLYFNVLNSLKP